MSVSSTVTRSQYAGNDSTVTAYPTGFFFASNDWVNVVVTDEDGVDTALVEGDDYILTGAEEEVGGDVVTTIAYDDTYNVTIFRVTPRTQLLDLAYNDRLPAELLEAAYDKLTYILQEIDSLGGNGDRSIRFPTSEPSEYETTLPTPVARRDSLIYFNATTGEMEVISSTDLATILAEDITGFDTSLYVTKAGDNTLTGDNTHEGLETFSGGAVFNGQVSFDPVALTDAASIAWDLSLGNLATVTIEGNRTLANPTNVAAGTYLLRVTQDGVGSRTLAYGANFKFPNGSAPVLSTAANAVDVLTFVSFGGDPLYLVSTHAFA